MLRALLPLAFIAALAVGLATTGRSAPPPDPPISIKTYFSPGGKCTDQIVALIGSATKSVHVLAFSFTSDPIAKALVDAAARPGVEVQVILDHGRSNERGSELGTLTAARVPVWLDKKHHEAHQKVIIVDDATVEVGSFNYSGDAETRNSENVNVIENAPETAALYEANFQEHLAHSQPVGK